ncbi:MAG: response regulator [Candidatus Contendobacter sp.]|nr:response regulator [Candidatus Contendobacter sp.]
MSMRILVVDDSSMMRKLLGKVLKPPGHQIVGEAKNGLEALELYKSLRPDLVTMDITMDGMDGLSAAREILRYDSAARILFLSNLDEEKYRGDVERLRAIGFINKHKSEEVLKLIESLEKTEKPGTGS